MSEGFAERWLSAEAEPAQLEALLGARVGAATARVSSPAASGTSSPQSGLDSVLGAQLFGALAHAAVVEQQASPAPAAAAT